MKDHHRLKTHRLYAIRKGETISAHLTRINAAHAKERKRWPIERQVAFNIAQECLTNMVLYGSVERPDPLPESKPFKSLEDIFV